MQIKYEAVFGDQALFDGAPEDAVAVFKSPKHDSRPAYYRLLNGHERYLSGEWIKVPQIDSQTFNAMRRIIKVPVISGDIDELITPEFDKWWSEEGEFIRSSGGNYERSFAYGAFRHLMPEILAARGVNKTPVWTMEDQKAGRLPDVGCEVMVIDTKMVCTVNAICKIYKSLSLTFPDGSLGMVELEDIDPIETPEEKTARLRSEWCNRAMDYSTIQQLYDAMLSGELAVPVAPEQNK